MPQLGEGGERVYERNLKLEYVAISPSGVGLPTYNFVSALLKQGPKAWVNETELGAEEAFACVLYLAIQKFGKG